MEASLKPVTPSFFKNILNSFHFQYYKRSLAHCKFIGELFKQGAFTEKNILSFIHELMKVKDILNIHCLCIILQIAGQKLSKTHNLDGIVHHILLFKNENTVLIKMSPTLQSLIFKIQNLHLKCWIHEEPLKLIEDNEQYISFENLPEQLKQLYDLKSYTVMAQCIIDECMAVLNGFDKININEIVHSLKYINSWLHYDQVSFVASMILITLNEDQSIRQKAGILLNLFIKKGLLLIDSVLSGIDKIMDDSELKIELPRLSDLLFDITSRITYLN
ncbi:uncharacterized protein LOC112689425 [Sipha flava]|uniref:Uncharacterized protein LOC112689425 n=1 Tax=Sipha flava TaxID=143950 RepID=A0A8B8G855_9HEMI|nr:uncharacterized protein LOC112689425 [Sipha flava]